MTYLFDGDKYYLVFKEDIRYEVGKELWERLRKAEELGDL